MQKIYNGVVQPWLCDMMGHMNIRYYMSMFDDAGYHLLTEATGWNRNADNWSGKGWADIHHDIQYVGELQAGDLVEVAGGVADIGTKSVTFFLEMKNKSTGAPAATMKAKIVYFDLKARKALPLTNEIRERLEDFRV